MNSSIGFSFSAPKYLRGKSKSVDRKLEGIGPSAGVLSDKHFDVDIVACPQTTD